MGDGSRPPTSTQQGHGQPGARDTEQTFLGSDLGRRKLFVLKVKYFCLKTAGLPASVGKITLACVWVCVCVHVCNQEELPG